MDTPVPQTLPSWLVPDRSTLPAVKRENLHTTYEAAFEGMLDKMTTSNISFHEAVRDDFRGLNPTHYLAWVLRDEGRKNRYYEALAITAEGVAADMLRIADASDSFEDVARSTLKISTRKWLLGVWNRKRFGETRQVEQNITIDISQAMADANARVAHSRGDVIDVTPREIE
jgi:hypothetical protein